jgi:hypothetical protein
MRVVPIKRNVTEHREGEGSGHNARTGALDLDGRRYLVCARGDSNWVRNARAAGEVVLARAMRRHRYAVRELPPSMRPPVLKAYLDRFASEVQRFFPVPKGSPVERFNDLAPRYPVFELQPLDGPAST